MRSMTEGEVHKPLSSYDRYLITRYIYPNYSDDMIDDVVGSLQPLELPPDVRLADLKLKAKDDDDEPD